MRCARCVNVIPSQKSNYGIKKIVREFSGGLPSEERLILPDGEISASGLGRGSEV